MKYIIDTGNNELDIQIYKNFGRINPNKNIYKRYNYDYLILQKGSIDKNYIKNINNLKKFSEPINIKYITPLLYNTDDINNNLLNNKQLLEIEYNKNDIYNLIKTIKNIFDVKNKNDYIKNIVNNLNKYINYLDETKKKEEEIFRYNNNYVYKINNNNNNKKIITKEEILLNKSLYPVGFI
jgi:hypothetical protein